MNMVNGDCCHHGDNDDHDDHHDYIDDHVEMVTQSDPNNRGDHGD